MIPAAGRRATRVARYDGVMATKNPRRSGNPATRASAPPGSASQSGGNRFERASRAALLRMTRLPSWAIPGAMLALMLVGISAPLPFAIPALVIAALFVLWLAYLSWTVIDTKGRLLRGLMFGLVVGVIFGRIFGVL
jgi:hypothetical protein